MSDEAVQIGEALVEPTQPRSSYLGRALGKAWARLMLAGTRPRPEQRPDGLEAFDMLGGWKGSDASRR